MASDPVKEIDSDIDKWETEGRAILADLTPKFAPRPMGTTKVSAEDAQFDYDNRGTDYWPKLAQTALQRAVTEGGNLGDALIELLKHDAGMSKSGGGGD